MLITNEALFDIFSKANQIVLQLAYLILTIISLYKILLDQWRR